MSTKPSIIRRIKEWIKFVRKKKNKLNDLPLTKAVIRNEELIPIYKKANSPPLKSILKNNYKVREESLLKIKNSKESFFKQINKKNTMGDSRPGNERSNLLKRKVIEAEVVTTRRPDYRFSDHKLQKNDTTKSLTNVNKKDKEPESALKINIFDNSCLVLPIASASQISSNGTLENKAKIRKSKLYKLNSKEETFSMMNLFKNEFSFMNLRKAAIRHFQSLKKGKSSSRERSMRSVSDTLDTVSEDQDNLNIIVENVLDKFPSECCLDVSSVLNGIQTSPKGRKRKRSSADGTVNVGVLDTESSASSAE